MSLASLSGLSFAIIGSTTGSPDLEVEAAKKQADVRETAAPGAKEEEQQHEGRARGGVQEEFIKNCTRARSDS